MDGDMNDILQKFNNILEDTTTPINTPTIVLVKNTILFFLSLLKLLKASIILWYTPNNTATTPPLTPGNTANAPIIKPAIN